MSGHVEGVLVLLAINIVYAYAAFLPIAAGLVALAVAVPVLRTRGIYLALATFALGQIVQATILNLDVVGGAAGYPVAAFIRLPTVALVAAVVVVLVWL